MSLFTQDKISAVQKANAEMLFKLAGKFFDGFEKLTQLNLQVLKATMSERTEMLQKARDSQNRLGFFDLQAGRFAQFPEKVAARFEPVDQAGQILLQIGSVIFSGLTVDSHRTVLARAVVRILDPFIVDVMGQGGQCHRRIASRQLGYSFLFR